MKKERIIRIRAGEKRKTVIVPEFLAGDIPQEEGRSLGAKAIAYLKNTWQVTRKEIKNGIVLLEEVENAKPSFVDGCSDSLPGGLEDVNGK